MAETAPAPAATRPSAARRTSAVRPPAPAVPDPTPRPRCTEVFHAPPPVEPAEPWW